MFLEEEQLVPREARIWYPRGTETNSMAPEHIEEKRQGIRLGWRESQGIHHVNLVRILLLVQEATEVFEQMNNIIWFVFEVLLTAIWNKESKGEEIEKKKPVNKLLQISGEIMMLAYGMVFQTVGYNPLGSQFFWWF